MLVCRASGETLQWDVPSLATSLAEGACNALVEKALSKMPHLEHEEVRTVPSPSKMKALPKTQHEEQREEGLREVPVVRRTGGGLAQLPSVAEDAGAGPARGLRPR